MMHKKAWMLPMVAIFCLAACATAAIPLKAPPLPDSVSIVPPSPDLPKHIAAFSGKWVGRTAISGVNTGGLGGKTTEDVMLVVEEIEGTKVQVVYFWWDSTSPASPSSDRVPVDYARIKGCQVISKSKPELVVPLRGWGDNPLILKMTDSNTLEGNREMSNPYWREFPTFTKSFRLKRAE